VRIFATSFSQSQRQCNARLCTSSAKLALPPTTVEIMLFVAGFRITGAMSHWWNAC
jgi:hypothetical protein